MRALVVSLIGVYQKRISHRLWTECLFHPS